MAHSLKSEKLAKKNSYTKTQKEQFFSVTCYN